ncbi:hypothetical protein M378DRAFT_162424 [Amanita muscaria Koide BX008]|uniref:Uncharacterized protein n=1 Tax=Amanita muscaria (strain Koide BX008) TaxID=946122 RepID=A0A0C2WTU6_AMAMK|nr:hypothetical protein M378DRAFT_162424 [Amanita muscaria Koide BX008]
MLPVARRIQVAVAFTSHKTVLDIVTRTSNRILVGFSLCRNSDWIELHHGNHRVST